VVVQLKPAGAEVTVYKTIAVPPLSVGANHETVIELDESTATTFRGADGGVAAMKRLLLSAESSDVAPALRAVT
jgi:hypothetical protein